MDTPLHMTSDREHMQGAIKKIVVPVIRALNFSGRFPHFRRRAENEHQMLMLYFNKYGGSFYVEAGRITDQGVRDLQEAWANSAKSLHESSLTVGHCHRSRRARLGPGGFLKDKDHWFVFGPDSTAGVYPGQSASVYDGIAMVVAAGLMEHSALFFEAAP